MSAIGLLLVANFMEPQCWIVTSPYTDILQYRLTTRQWLDTPLIHKRLGAAAGILWVWGVPAGHLTWER
jgi:hypothetical protein